MDNLQLIEEAKKVTEPRKLSFDNTAGGVGAAILTVKGNVYRGVCIDTSSSMGFCAEHGAVAAMITAGESQIVKVVAVHKDDAGKWYILPPCGRRREFMKQINEKSLNADIILSKTKTEKLNDLLPYNNWPEPLDS